MSSFARWPFSGGAKPGAPQAQPGVGGDDAAGDTGSAAAASAWPAASVDAASSDAQDLVPWDPLSATGGPPDGLDAILQACGAVELASLQGAKADAWLGASFAITGLEGMHELLGAPW